MHKDERREGGGEIGGRDRRGKAELGKGVKKMWERGREIGEREGLEEGDRGHMERGREEAIPSHLFHCRLCISPQLALTGSRRKSDRNCSSDCS